MFLRCLLLILPMALAACQSTAAGRASATVNLSDPGTEAAVKSALARAVGKARVELGPTDGPDTAVVTVLPPRPGPYETHSTALPIAFDIALEDGACLAIRRDTHEIYPLDGVACRTK